MSKGKPVAEEVKDKIRQLKQAGHSWDEIQSTLKVSRSTIGRALKGKKQKRRKSSLKLEVAKEALKAAHHSTLIDEMPSMRELEIKARAITVMLGIERMKEIIQEMQDKFNILK